MVYDTGRPIDADGDGLPGGDRVTTFHRLFGDVHGDAFVTGADFVSFRLAYGAAAGGPAFDPALDYNGDGSITGADFVPFRLRFGTGI